MMNSKKITTILVVAILVLATLVRFWKIEYVPFPNDADELAHIFAGQSLFDVGRPIAWSSFKQSDGEWQRLSLSSSAVSEPAFFKMTNPWFDHTPLLAIMMGAWSKLLGYHFLSIPPALLYRLPFLLISILSLILVYQIAKQLFGQIPALISLTLLSFSPSLIFAQRMVIPENLLTLIFLAAIYLYINHQSIFYLILLSCLAGLTKITGLIMVPVFCLAYLAEKKYQQAVIYAAASLFLAGVLNLYYGASIDLHQFLNALTSQSYRLLGWSNPTFIFSTPGLLNKVMYDFSYYLILLCGLWIFTATANKPAKILATFIVALLATIWATSAEQDMLGWYRIPLFVCLGVGSASFFQERKYQLPIILLATTIISNLGIVRFPRTPLPETMTLRLIVAGFLTISALLIYFWPKLKHQVLILSLLLTIYMVQSFYVVNTYFQAKCSDAICPTPLVTFNGLIKKLI